MSWRSQILVVFLSLAVAIHAFAAEWYKDYAKAQGAVKSNDCGRAVPLLLQALQQNPTTGLRVPTYGTMRMEYIPHLYLAECAYKSGNISQAANYLKEAEASGAASSSKASEFAQVKEQVQSQIQQVKKEPPPKPPAPSTTSNPPPAPAPQVAAPSPKQSVVPPKPAGPTPEQQAAAERHAVINRTLKEANEAVSSGRFDAAREAANKVLLIDPSNDQARSLLSQIVLKEAEETKKRDKERKFAEINRAVKNGDWANAESLAMNLKSQYPSDSEVASIVEQVVKQKNALLQKSSEDELRKALERQVLIAYYKGDYETSIQLARQALEKSSDDWRLHFFLGCSYAALSLLQDDNKQPRLDLAKENFRKARSLGGNSTPPPYISPKILDIYRSS
jgi:hypothetical protein